MTQPPDGYRQEPDPTEQFPPPYGPAAAADPADPTASEPTAAQPRTGIRRGVVLTAVALVVVLAIAGGTLAAWLLLRDSDQDGASDPVAAVNAFLETVYQKQDAVAASAQVCSEARDEAALEIKIGTIREYDDTYRRPRFNWSQPEVVEESGQLAIVAVTVTMITGDEKSAEQTLHVSVLDKEARGWWICDVNSVPAADTEHDDSAGDPAEDDAGEEDGGEDGGEDGAGESDGG